MYTYAELVKMYRKRTEEAITPPSNANLMRGYVASLKKRAMRGGAHHRCRPLIKEYDADPATFMDKYPPLEEYADNDYYVLTPLKSFGYIYGMQQPNENLIKMLQFFRFLSEERGVVRLICLDCMLCEKDYWEDIIAKIKPGNLFFNKSIEDYKPYTFENAMSILALVDRDTTPTVFHCLAGHGRTGSVMYLILFYFKCRENRALLREELPTAEYVKGADGKVSAKDHDEIAATWLADEYGYDAADEFYKGDIVLRCNRINVANQAIANTLQIHYPTGELIPYMQYQKDAGKYSLIHQQLSQADVSTDPVRSFIQDIEEMSAAPQSPDRKGRPGSASHKGDLKSVSSDAKRGTPVAVVDDSSDASATRKRQSPSERQRRKKQKGTRSSR